MVDELPATTAHMGTSMAMAKKVYDSATREAKGARQSQIIAKLMTAAPLTPQEMRPATVGS